MSANNLMALGLYTSGDSLSGSIYQKGQFFCYAFASIGFLYFTFTLLNLKGTLFRKILTFLVSSVTICGILINDSILDMSRQITRKVVIFNYSFIFHEMQLGILFNILLAVIIIGMAYLFSLLLFAYTKKGKRDLLFFIISFFIFLASIIFDTFITCGIIVFLYTIEYSFFIMIMVMDFTLQKRFVETFSEIERLNLNLEIKISERTCEIQKMTEILAKTNKDLEEKNNTLAELAERDGMTKLLNHDTFLVRTSSLLNLAKRNNFSIGVILMDVDYFKNINDDYGHLAGDHVIIKIAEILHADSRVYDIKGRYENEDKSESLLRSYDTIGRYGGDEFAIALPFCGLNEIKIIADRICAQVRKLSFADYPDIQITCSLGCAVLLNPSLCEDELQLIKVSDRALYRAKEQGRNRSVILEIE